MNNIIILPNYIQIYIIKILCRFINKNNKLVDINKNSKDDYRNNEQDIKKLMLSLSLVSKLWLKTIQTHLTVCVDFNYVLNSSSSDDTNSTTTSKSTSIIKIENIKTLKLHYDNEKTWFYRKLGGPNGEEFEIKTEYINQQLKLLSNVSSLKKLVLRNIKSADDRSNNEINKLETLYQCNATESNITLLEYVLNEETTIETVPSFEKISSVNTIGINLCYDKESILKAFSNWYKSLSTIYISDYVNDIERNGFSLYEILSTTENGIYLSNIEIIEFFYCEITLKDVISLLKNTKKLKSISFDFCFKSLIYFLSSKEDKIKFNLQRCQCSSVILNQDNDDDEIQIQKEFDENWVLFEKLVNGSSNDHEKILYLYFNNYCIYQGEQLLYQDYPVSFIEKFSNFIISCSNLFSFSIVGITPLIYKEIMNRNKSIKNYEINLIDTPQDVTYYFISTIESLIYQNDHINQISISRFEFNQEDSEYKKEDILNFKSN